MYHLGDTDVHMYAAQPIPQRRTALDIMREVRSERAARGENVVPLRHTDASGAQLDFLRTLLRDRVHPYASDILEENVRVWTGGRPLSRDEASRTITFLKGRPFRDARGTNSPAAVDEFNRLVRDNGLCDGRYAIDSTDETPHTVFWTIRERTAAKSGKKYFALFQRIGGQGDVYYKGSMAAKLEIVRRIVVDPKAAMIRFGAELGECGSCGRELTSEESRAAGIGPVCAAKRGW